MSPATGPAPGPVADPAPGAELEAARAEVCETARRLVADGLVVGTSGNVSVRVGGLVAVTPTGVRYPGMRPADIPVVDLDGTLVHGDLKPTSELLFHLAAYRELGPGSGPVGAVVHTHAVHATAVSTLVDELPPIHYTAAVLGGVVRVAPYATYGTERLAAGMVEALRDRSGCLLANHGTVTVGPDLETAYERAAHLEWLCRVWLTARGAGEPRLLEHAEIDRVVEKLRGYGQG